MLFFSAIVMQIRKQAGGDHTNYVSNIIVGAQTPTTPPMESARTAHVTNKTAAPSTPSKQPQTGAPEKISNNRRKSSISERRILPSTSDPNLLANIMQDMDRSATTTSAEGASVSVAATLKVLTPVQLNNGQMGQQSQRFPTQHRVQQPQQQPQQQQQAQLPQAQQQPQQQQAQHPQVQRQLYQQQFDSYQQKNQPKQYQNRHQQHQQIRQQNPNQHLQHPNHHQQPQIHQQQPQSHQQQPQSHQQQPQSHQQQPQVHQQNPHRPNWSQNGQVDQQQQPHRYQVASNGNMSQQQPMLGSVGQKTPRIGYQFGLELLNPHSNLIPG
jgi:hypothetical protein